MDEATFRQEVLDRLSRIARALEEALELRKANGAPKQQKQSGAAPKRANDKPGQFEVVGLVTTLTDPNDWGFVKVVIDRCELSTKVNAHIQAFAAAYANDIKLKVTYDEEEKGKYVNKYVRTIEQLGAVERPPAEEEAF